MINLFLIVITFNTFIYILNLNTKINFILSNKMAGKDTKIVKKKKGVEETDKLIDIINNLTLFFILDGDKSAGVKNIYSFLDKSCTYVDTNQIKNNIFMDTQKKHKCEQLFKSDIHDCIQGQKNKDQDEAIKYMINTHGYANKNIFIYVGGYTSDKTVDHTIPIIIETNIKNDIKYISNICIQNSGYFHENTNDIKTMDPLSNYVYKININGEQIFNNSIAYILKILYNNTTVYDLYQRQELFLQNWKVILDKKNDYYDSFFLRTKITYIKEEDRSLTQSIYNRYPNNVKKQSPVIRHKDSAYNDLLFFYNFYTRQ